MFQAMLPVKRTKRARRKLSLAEAAPSGAPGTKSPGRGAHAPLRVVHVLGGLSYGGTERLCLDVVRHAPDEGCATIVVLDASRRDMETSFRAAPTVRIVFSPHSPRRRLPLFQWLRVTLAALQADAVLIYTFGTTHLLVALAARLARVRAVAVSAGTHPPATRGRWKWGALVGVSRLLKVPIESCSESVDAALRSLRIPMPVGSGVIPNGCDVDDIAARAESTRDGRVTGGPVVVGMVARMDCSKDHETLIRAFSALQREYRSPEIKLWLVGDGGRRQHLQKLALRLGLSEDVRFWGYRPDVAELLGQMDIYAFSTTRDEGFGIAIAEAMAAGLPVLATDVPACREVLGNGSAGILIPGGCPECWVSTLAHLVADPGARAYWARRSYARVRAHYDVSLCSRTWHEVLRTHCERRSS